MPGVVNLVDQQGTAITVPVEQAADLLSRGYRQESPDEAVARSLKSEREEYYGGPGGKVVAFGAGVLSGATLGLSDVGLSALGGGEDLRGLQEVNPYTHLGGQIAGEIAATFIPGIGEIAPAGRLARFATEAGELVHGTGALSRVGRLAVTGAVEGSVSNAGQYLGQMALADKPASAEGFLASLGSGALYGGATAGALGIAGEGLVAARRLLPETELTPIAARRSRDEAMREVSQAVDDSKNLDEVARAKARRIREEAAARDPQLRAELDSIARQKAQDLADAHVGAARARQAKLEADAAAAQSRAEAAAARAERAKAPGKPTRKAMQGEAPVSPSPLAQDAAGIASDIVTPDPDALLRQLHGTKQGLDSGKSIAELSARRKETLVEDALNARVAQIDPQMDRLVRHLEGLTDAREQVAAWLDKYPTGKLKAFEYAEGMRKKSGFAEVVPQGEGNLLTPRGREFELRGGEADRLAFESKVARGDLHRIVDDPFVTAEEKALAQRALTLSGEEQAQALAELQAKRTAKQIVGASETDPRLSVDDHVERALEGHTDLADDIDDATDAIGQLEQKTADLADELGPEAPASAAERARHYRQAHAAADESAQKASEDMLADADRAAKVVELGEVPKAKLGAFSKLEHAGKMLEALQMLGIPVPGVKDIPVVGPLLSMYLRAKLAMRVAGRHGGKVLRTAETEIASRAATTKTKLVRAVDRVMAGGARVASSPKAAVTAAVLGTVLFDDRDPSTRERQTTKKDDDIETLYLARRDELQRAMRPGAVREAIRRRIRTTDQALLDAITEAETRRLKFLFDKMPDAPAPFPLLAESQPQVPARSELDKWARYIDAANRPAETMEAILDGQLVSQEAAETIREVSPRLLQDVQQRFVEAALEKGTKMPYKRRVQLSLMLGLPLDPSQSPESAAFLATLYAQKAPGAAAASQASMIDSRAAERADPETRH